MERLDGAGEDHLQESSLHRVVRRAPGARKPSGGRPADQCSRQGGGGRQPALSVWGAAAPPLGTL